MAAQHIGRLIGWIAACVASPVILRSMFGSPWGSVGVACSAVDMMLCTLALRLDVPIFTTDPDFTRYARVLHLHVVNAEQVNASLRRAKKREADES